MSKKLAQEKQEAQKQQQLKQQTEDANSNASLHDVNAPFDSTEVKNQSNKEQNDNKIYTQQANKRIDAETDNHIDNISPKHEIEPVHETSSKETLYKTMDTQPDVEQQTKQHPEDTNNKHVQNHENAHKTSIDGSNFNEDQVNSKSNTQTPITQGQSRHHTHDTNSNPNTDKQDLVNDAIRDVDVQKLITTMVQQSLSHLQAQQKTNNYSASAETKKQHVANSFLNHQAPAEQEDFHLQKQTEKADEVQQFEDSNYKETSTTTKQTNIETSELKNNQKPNKDKMNVFFSLFKKETKK
ncbi:hypothetical protein CAI16_18710 [Virgibacillus dokdonensis]|uniref:Uncharacterized protein n=1 Tax=Virgibacillus dokdonensis TaxID=302167 RepID=A0A3E0WIF7_9BACI|nr:hypothetical protein [Virgibacillus dokdonensis]RFA32229.1 hypothetical protein CAI16_18710 [Virgibacillus dokdonensis]